MKVFVVPKGVDGFLLNHETGQVSDWTTRRNLEFTDSDLSFDVVRMSNGRVDEADWGSNYGRVQRWCEQLYMGFTSGKYTLVVKSKNVATYA